MHCIMLPQSPYLLLTVSGRQHTLGVFTLFIELLIVLQGHLYPWIDHTQGVVATHWNTTDCCLFFECHNTISDSKIFCLSEESKFWYTFTPSLAHCHSFSGITPLVTGRYSITCQLLLIHCSITTSSLTLFST